jgi:hypothetical protein
MASFSNASLLASNTAATNESLATNAAIAQESMKANTANQVIASAVTNNQASNELAKKFSDFAKSIFQ